jgi:hypothetical protein
LGLRDKKWEQFVTDQLEQLDHLDLRVLQVLAYLLAQQLL